MASPGELASVSFTGHGRMDNVDRQFCQNPVVPHQAPEGSAAFAGMSGGQNIQKSNAIPPMSYFQQASEQLKLEPHSESGYLEDLNSVNCPRESRRDLMELGEICKNRIESAGSSHFNEGIEGYGSLKGSQAKLTDFACTVCNKRFSRQFVLKRHMVTHTGVRDFKCRICGTGFIDATGLKIHVRIHTGVKPFSCEVCGKSFTRAQEVKRHSITHLRQKAGHKCQYCTHTFPDTAVLSSHVYKLHTLQRSFPCVICGLTFETKMAVHDHLKLHLLKDGKSTSESLVDENGTKQKEDYHKCPVCDKIFSGKTDLNRHVRIHTTPDDFICSVCGVGFHEASELKLHKKTHTGEQSHACHICDKGFNCYQNLALHMDIHKDLTGACCNICNIAFNDVFSLNDHIGTSKECCDSLKMQFPPECDMKDYSCEICGKVFNRMQEVKRHAITHTRPYMGHKCQYCSLKFKDTALLAAHVEKDHQQQKSFPCVICSGNFETKFAIHEHLKFHLVNDIVPQSASEQFKDEDNHDEKSPEKFHQCPVCDKVFGRKTDVTRHFKIHTNQKDFVCGICSIGFRESSAMRVHLRTHTGERPFQCYICRKRFNRGPDVARHMNVHRDKIDLLCKICNLVFEDVSSLNLHMGGHQIRLPTSPKSFVESVKLPLGDQNREMPADVEKPGYVTDKPGYVADKPGYVADKPGYVTDKSGYVTEMGDNSNNIAQRGDYSYNTLADAVSKMEDASKEKESVGNNLKESENIFNRTPENAFNNATTTPKIQMVYDPKVELSPQGNPPEIQSEFNSKNKNFDKFFTGKNYFCHICQFRFGRSQDLKRHINNLHPGEPPFKCAVCEVSFDERDLLKTHMMSHTLYSPTCRDCGVTFPNDAKLQSHMKFHTGEYRFKCDLCHTAFLRSGDMKRHLLIHSADKPYKCSLCDIACVTSHALDIHFRKHTGERPFPCRVCEKGFSRKYDLKKHMSVHKTPRPAPTGLL